MLGESRSSRSCAGSVAAGSVAAGSVAAVAAVAGSVADAARHQHNLRRRSPTDINCTFVPRSLAQVPEHLPSDKRCMSVHWRPSADRPSLMLTTITMKMLSDDETPMKVELATEILKL